MNTDYSAPDMIKAWLECAFWFAAFAAALIYIAKQLRGPDAKPANELLSQTGDELARRVTHLEAENSKVWVKMELDARKLERQIADVDKNVGELGATLEMVNQNCNLMKLSLENLTRRK